MFQLTELKTTISREVIAGITTFSAMMYILVVNPAILSQTGMDSGSLLAATVFSSAVMTLSMGLFTNLPIALAPGMGLNAFFTYTLCIGHGLSWQSALGLVFYSGILFLIVTLSGLRPKIMAAIPISVRKGLTFGIGVFIALIGLKNAGIVVESKATLITLGNFKEPSVAIVFLGVLVAAVLHRKKIPASLLISMIFITVSFLVMGKIKAPEQIFSTPPSIAPTFLKLDLLYFWQHLSIALPLMLSLFFVDFFDNMGTLIGVTTRAKLVDEHGQIRNIDRALKADAFAACFGSMLGTSSVTSYIESAAGVEQGGRTGLTAVTVAGCFLIALFLAPLFLAVPLAATTPALVMVGVFMMGEIKGIDFEDLNEALPAFITMAMIPFSFSISEGLGLGLVSYAVLRVFTGKAEKKDTVTFVIASLFLIHLLF
jgi:AGZA family xanthine/uracil permease-like MFS transporter